MSDLDSTVLHAATKVAVLSGHLVTLLEQLNQRFFMAGEPTLPSGNFSGGMQAELLGALALQKRVVTENSALVRSMLRQQRRQRKALVARQHTVAVGEPGEKSLGPRGRLIKVTGEENPLPRESSCQSFTKRQREIIDLVKLGYDNREIAESLSLAEQTVKNHLNTIFGKAGVSRRADLAVRTNRVDDFPTRDLDECLPADQAGRGSLARTAHN